MTGRPKRGLGVRRRVLAALAIGSMLAGVPQRGEAAPVTASSVALTAPARKDNRPNIILILADDLGVEGIHAYGSEYSTPNIDRLAREGMRFDNAHATPLCSPSRTRIMTGQENHRNYDAFGYLAPGQTTFGNVMKQAGYATGIVGKWQLSGNGFDGRIGITPQQAGFDESLLWQLKPLDAKGSRYWGPTRSLNGKTRIREEGFGPDVDNDFAIDFVTRHKDQPFFLYYPMVLTHSPFVSTPDTRDVVGAKQRFAGMISYMDRKVGQLLDKLRELGLDDNTVVIFTGDNGTNRQITSLRYGFEVKGGKGTPTISGTHVPMIVRAPSIVAAGTVSSALFDFTDVLPTLAALGGAKIATVVDGVSQLPVLKRKVVSVRDSIFIHYAPRWLFDPARFIFDADWKLYGDGRFVSIDAVKGTETPVDVRTLKGHAAKRYAALRKALDQVKDGPLDDDKFPMCADRSSRIADQPAIKAGCDLIDGPLDS